jgi:5-methylcytosine-specific restriction endonuclease McrA
MPYRPATYQPPIHYRRNPPRRRSSRARGYGSAWERVRAESLRAIARRQGDDAYSPRVPCCECGPECCPAGCRLPGTHLDHVKAVSGPEDPLFWEPTNHQALAQRCHSRKTNRHDGGFGNKKRPYGKD